MTKSQSQWMAQAAACRCAFAKTKDRFWADACRNSVAVAKAHRGAAKCADILREVA